MNIEKVALKELFETKSLDLLSKIKKDYFVRPVPKVIFSALQSYVNTFHKIPDLGIFIAKLKAKLPEGKQEIYTGYLESLKDISERTPHNELIAALEDNHVVTLVDKNIEALVMAGQIRDVNAIKTIVAKLSENLTSSEKIPEDMQEITYTPANIKLIDPFLPTMRKHMKLGGLVIIGGASGAGKSNLGLNQILYSYDQGHNVCLLNLELGRDETISRMYSIANLEPFSSVYGNKDPVVVDKINKWRKSYFDRDNRFYIQTTGYDDIEIENIIKSMAAKGVTVFLIDYLNLVEVSSEEEWRGLTKLIKKLHRLTQELGIVIMTPTQVNMSDTKEEDGELKVTTRGSKELEFSATVFLFIYQTQEEKEEHTARIFTLKARNAEKKTYIVEPRFRTMSYLDTGMVL